MNLFTITLDRDGKQPLYAQLYQYIVEEIMAGHLQSGERLPSKKAIAAHLQISQNTVETAYGLLVQEGYVFSRPKSGFYVSPIEDLVVIPRAELPALSVPPSAPSTTYRYDFHTNAVDIPSFPFSTWAKLSRETLADGPNLLTAGSAQGDLPLREALSKYLHEFRGVRCTPEQIVIGAGMEYLLPLVYQLLDVPLFAVEDPGYRKAALLLENSGGHIVPITLDQHGIRPGALAKSGAACAYITPSHQFPTGRIMPIGRRIQLLSWAAEREGRYLIEDDYNSEFTFSGKPIPAVQGLDKAGHVIYMSTFSRTLAPSIRIAYMVLPQPLLERFHQRFSDYASTVSRFEQHTLLRFLQGGYLSRHLSRVKHIYRKRRDTLLSFFSTAQIPGGAELSGERAGLHLLATFTPETAERLLRRAEEEHIRIHRVSDYCFRRGHFGRHTLLFGYGGMNETQLLEALTLLFSP